MKFHRAFVEDLDNSDDMIPCAIITQFQGTSLFCKVFFPAKFSFFKIQEKNLAGKNLLFKKVNLLCKRVFSNFNAGKLDKLLEESQEVGLKINISKSKDLRVYLGSKVADGKHCWT
jgi:hypothetical protein